MVARKKTTDSAPKTTETRAERKKRLAAEAAAKAAAEDSTTEDTPSSSDPEDETSDGTSNASTDPDSSNTEDEETSPEEASPKETVTVISDKKFTLREGAEVLTVHPGIQELEPKWANHWYVKAHGVKVYQPKKSS